jgi:SAM-dependent methyltransferase
MTSSNYQKYQTQNPVMRKVIRRFLDHLCARIVEIRPKTIIDLGCGEGVVASEIHRVLPDVRYVGIDANGEAIRMARASNPNCEFLEGDIFDGHPDGAVADLALCVEVLEHLDQPDLALGRIAAASSDYVVVSVPWEPYFRLGNLLRGKYLANWGNHPEHVQQFSPGSLRDLVTRHFSFVGIDTCFPWLIATARKRSAEDEATARDE